MNLLYKGMICAQFAWNAQWFYLGRYIFPIIYLEKGVIFCLTILNILSQMILCQVETEPVIM